jgi:hypothetical protein
MDKHSCSIPIIGDVLSDLIQAIPFSAHVRDVGTGKYLLANRYQAKFNGFEPNGEKIIGLTNADLQANWSQTTRHLIPSIQHQVKFRDFFARLNYEVQCSKRIVSYRERWISGGTGFLYFGESKKIPLLSENKKVIAILTFSEEVTSKVNLLDLYYAYKSYYAKQMAIRQFLHYLDIAHFFTQAPTEAQLITLIAMRENSQAKYIARFLNISPQTAEIHIRNLRKKVKDFELNTLLSLIRNGNKSIYY